MDPYVTQKFTLPKNAQLVKIPLWGTEEPSEHLSVPFSRVILAKQRTTQRVIEDEFVPLFESFLRGIIEPQHSPIEFGNTLSLMHTFFERYEYKKSFKSESVWRVFKRMIQAWVAEKELPEPDVYGLMQSLGWLYRFFTLLNTPIPEVHVTHSSAAAFCSLPCVISKIKRDTPFLLTEHGVYLREQYLSLAKRSYSPYLNTFLIRLVRAIARLNYAFADQVSPVCEYNTRWEEQFGVDPKKIQVIYNGVDKSVFTVAEVRNPRPTVVTVARVDPIKDLLSLIRAADLVRKHVPDVLFLVYGGVSVPEYYEECLALVDELDLTETFRFEGHTTNMAAAYQRGDVIALSSISEAFPYSVVEAMMTGKPVVATDVGGIREALMDTGILVRPRSPQELAQAMTELILQPELRQSLGQEARERALNLFTLDLVLDHHLKTYLNLTTTRLETSDRSVGQTEDSQRRIEQQLYIERAYALQDYGYHQEAISVFRRAMKLDIESVAIPVILLGLATSYHALGMDAAADHEIVKFRILTSQSKASPA